MSEQKREFYAKVEVTSTRTEYVERWVEASSAEEAEQKLLGGDYDETIDHEEDTDSEERIVGPIMERIV